MTIMELADRAHHLATDARVHRSTDEAVLRAIEALAEAVARLATATPEPGREREGQ